jgi:hypothetical protein
MPWMRQFSTRAFDDTVELEANLAERIHATALTVKNRVCLLLDPPFNPDFELQAFPVVLHRTSVHRIHGYVATSRVAGMHRGFCRIEQAWFTQELLPALQQGSLSLLKAAFSLDPAKRILLYSGVVQHYKFCSHYVIVLRGLEVFRNAASDSIQDSP